MIGEMVELNLLNGKRFLGKVTLKDDHGLTLYCIPIKGLESVPPGKDAIPTMREMMQTVYFPWQQVEYIDIGGEPIGYDDLYSSWFQGKTVAEFFEKATLSQQDRDEEASIG